MKKLINISVFCFLLAFLMFILMPKDEGLERTAMTFIASGSVIIGASFVAAYYKNKRRNKRFKDKNFF